MDILAQIMEEEATTNGNLPQGFLFASIKNVGTSTALVNNVPLPPGEAKSYPFVGKGYQAVNYEPQGSTLRILRIL